MLIRSRGPMMALDGNMEVWPEDGFDEEKR
jgi:hypothetical protein